MDQTDNSINDNRSDKQCRNSRVIILSDPERPKFDEIQVQRAEPISLAEMNTSDKIDLAKVTLKKELRNICEIYSQGPICLGSGARLITKAANMDGVIADFEFDEKIVSVCTPIAFLYGVLLEGYLICVIGGRPLWQ